MHGCWYNGGCGRSKPRSKKKPSEMDSDSFSILEDSLAMFSWYFVSTLSIYSTSFLLISKSLWAMVIICESAGIYRHRFNFSCL